MRETAVFAFIFVCASMFLPFGAGAVSSGALVKGSGSAVYYLLDGKRYVFPNERIYFSWYVDFGSVEIVSDAELASYLIGGNVTYRPGARLVKIQTDPKTYAVSKGGVLRWVTSEEVARALYGPAWNTEVHDISDAYFLDYRLGAAVSAPDGFDLAFESAVAGIFEDVTARNAAIDPGADPASTVTRAVQDGLWSDPKTWSPSVVPSDGAQVEIPFGRTVRYDVEATAELSSLNVGGRLEFVSDAHTALAAKMIVVGGSMAVGTPEEPVPASRRATVTLTGSSPFGISDDGLHVGGFLDIHGAAREVAWTTLKETAEAGSASLLLADAPDWSAGEEIVIATGSANHTETERRTIVSVDGMLVTLAAPLDYAHRADAYRRSEVALLDRNVRLIGAGEGQGSRITVGGRGGLRIEGAAIEGFGRKGIAGHHPIFFDAAGTATDSYVRNAVFDRSGNGCVVLSQTNGVSIDDTVAVGITGTCHLFMDGASDAVSYRRNLVIGLEGDGASAFVVRNPSTFLSGNIAVGAPAHGFRFELPESATRSDGRLLRPREASLAGFSGNGAHANGGDGLFVGGDGTGEYSPSSTAVFSGFEASFNGGYGFNLHGANLVVTGALLVGNRVGGTFSAFAADFFDSLVVGFPDAILDSPETQAEVGGEDPGRFGFIFNDGPVSVNGVTFRNFMPAEGLNAAAFSFEPSNPHVPDPRNNYHNVTFEQAQKWFVYPPSDVGDFLAVVRDLDAGETVASADPFLDFDCLAEEGHIMTCRGNFSQLVVVFRDGPKDRPVRFIRLDTGSAFTLYPGPAFDGQYAYITLAEGLGFMIEGPPARGVSLDWTGATQPILLRIPVGNVPSVRINGASAVVSEDPDPGEYAYDAFSGDVIIHLPAGATADTTW